jgi:hypothetical protein
MVSCGNTVLFESVTVCGALDTAKIELLNCEFFFWVQMKE